MKSSENSDCPWTLTDLNCTNNHSYPLLLRSCTALMACYKLVYSLPLTSFHVEVSPSLTAY